MCLSELSNLLDHVPVLVSSYGNEMHFVLSVELVLFAWNKNWQNGWRGNVVILVYCMLGKCLISFSEKLPKFEKSKTKMVR